MTLTSSIEYMPTDLKRAMAERMWENNRSTQRVSCAGLADMSEEFYAKVAATKDSAVRVAFLANPHAPEALVTSTLKAERRAQVIAQAIKSARSSAARRALLIEVARERMRLRPTIALAESLIDVSDLEQDLSLLITRALVSTPRRLSDATSYRLSGLLGSLPPGQAEDIITMAVGHQHILDVLNGAPAVSRETFAVASREVVNEVVHEQAYRWNGARHQDTRAHYVASALERTMLASGADETWLSEFSRMVQSVSNPPMRSALTTVLTRLTNRLEDIEEHSIDVSLDMLIFTAGRGDENAMITVARHPDADTETVRRMLAFLAGSQPGTALDIAVERGQQDWLVSARAAYLARSGHLTAALGGHEALARAKAATLVTEMMHNLKGRSWLLSDDLDSINVLLEVAGPQGLSALPWADTLRLLNGSGAWTSTSGTLFADLCRARLTSPEHWSALDSLSSNWQASTGELFDAVESICGDLAA